MSGKCYLCATSFGFFKKEVGCKNCGFAFCKDCLTHKLPIPKLKNEVHKVCGSCHKVLTGTAKKPADPSKYSPPEAYKKRVAALEQKQHQPGKPGPSHHGRGASNAVNTNKYKGLSKEDIAIAERLQKLKDERKKEAGPVPSQNDIERRLAGLKEDRPAPPSADEMSRRLAQLKGQDPDAVNKPHVFKKETRPEQTQIDELLGQIHDEVEIDSHGINAASDVQQRLDHLKGKEPSTSTNDATARNVPSVSKGYKTGSGEDIDLDEMNRLMAQAAKEMEVDAHRAIADMQKDKDLMARFDQLKKERKARQKAGNKDGQDDSDNDQTEEDLGKKYAHLQEEFDDSEDEEEAIKRILKQSLAEVAIDQEVEASGHSIPSVSHKAKSKETEKSKAKIKDKKKSANPVPAALRQEDSDDELSESDEFPWCCICNEDATLKCIGCDYDLYCKRCYKEGHDKLDWEDHKTFPFSPRKAKKR